MDFAGALFNVNTIVIVLGWLIGGLVVVVGMRTQVSHLAGEIGLLRTALVSMTTRLDIHAEQLAYLRGIQDARSEMGYPAVTQKERKP